MFGASSLIWGSELQRNQFVFSADIDNQWAARWATLIQSEKKYKS
jgi:hypothetical protein